MLVLFLCLWESFYSSSVRFVGAWWLLEDWPSRNIEFANQSIHRCAREAQATVRVDQFPPSIRWIQGAGFSWLRTSIACPLAINLVDRNTASQTHPVLHLASLDRCEGCHQPLDWTREKWGWERYLNRPVEALTLIRFRAIQSALSWFALVALETEQY